MCAAARMLTAASMSKIHDEFSRAVRIVMAVRSVEADNEADGASAIDELFRSVADDEAALRQLAR